ncbi:hypothetical protein B9Z51_12270 [Limnohabitans sp. T6-5]|nr:hypothetical protein B9Z51_12270 [Limnohabitans sp. T6-5]
MPACAISPADRRQQVRKIGNDLLQNYGKKQYYTIEEVKAANHRNKVDFDFVCWSYAAFNSHKDFDDYHRSVGESCDYVSMKSDMLSSVSNVTDTSWFDFDLSWLEFPDIDFSLFDFLDF